jgi:hypothetical protein
MDYHHIQNAKTPGRMRNRGENAIRAPMTGIKGGQGKEAIMQTPHHALGKSNPNNDQLFSNHKKRRASYSQ